ncbi:phage tail protein [Neolewinella lacunae]|uniref:Phage tail protein n=1 Tax=Neolewinella lacunae TaxID=1517758 RepID=A0A923PFM4_9BACT|nr:phage tail protein [Neolewinella lacunae]MBC6993248.1 phage tail protein [Neolewinella lacunae]MDN3635705.1 phage tail protein [Neolewinella lacunae]
MQPPFAVGFHFSVHFAFDIGSVDYRFQSVSGLGVEYATEAVVEGGENRFEHKLPVRTQYSDLVLKRALVTDSALVTWCREAFEERVFAPTTVTVHLLDPAGVPLRSWHVDRAWPRKWSISDLNAEENALVIESLELSYRTFRVN